MKSMLRTQAKGSKALTSRPKQSGSCTDGGSWNEYKEDLLQISPSWKASLVELKVEDAVSVSGPLAPFIDAAPGSIFTVNMKKAMTAFISGVRYTHEAMQQIHTNTRTLIIRVLNATARSGSSPRTEHTHRQHHVDTNEMR